MIYKVISGLSRYDYSLQGPVLFIPFNQALCKLSNLSNCHEVNPPSELPYSLQGVMATLQCLSQANSPVSSVPFLLQLQSHLPPSSSLCKLSSLIHPSDFHPSTLSLLRHKWGFHPGGWGKPSSDKYNRPLYGDISGVLPKASNVNVSAPINKNLWGVNELEPEEEEEEESETEEAPNPVHPPMAYKHPQASKHPQGSHLWYLPSQEGSKHPISSSFGRQGRAASQDQDTFSPSIDYVNGVSGLQITQLTSPSNPDGPSYGAKSLGVAQLAFTQVRAELHELNKKYNTLAAKLHSHTRARILKTTNPGDVMISQNAKKFCILYHLWVPENLFPVGPWTDVDPHSPSRWRTAELRAAGNRAELYVMMPQELHGPMTSYSQFESMFGGAVNVERSNALKVVKDSTTILFAPLKLNPKVFAGPRAEEAKDRDILALLKKGGEGEYTQLAPILFADPLAMVAEDLFKHQILVNIARIIMYGKGVLTEKKRPGPKGRGQKMGALSVTEGMVRFLLSHDPELVPVGTETGIPYQGWALNVLDFFNQGVFGKKAPLPTTESSVPPSDMPCSWEDNILAQLGNAARSSQHAEPLAGSTPATTISTTTAHTIDTVIPVPSSLSSNQHAVPMPQVDIPVVTSSRTTLSMTISPRTSVVSSTSDLQVQVSQLSLGCGQGPEPSVSTRCKAPTGKRKTSTTAPPTDAAQEPVGRVTCNHKGGKAGNN
ncbi:hypothetical protein PAXINDRAFT_11299 [Paxillus involutus ATCC 200175]|uniref:Uncharacterized protein n=1 Tax=Paxillus involutus ATCC 200175 TaxID=664439 RepID=A0A0C9TZB7_PAXIN|nr:hypothetical protein PAXINDRAFT_11299 [Paxillus involutus ATCC 200175]